MPLALAIDKMELRISPGSSGLYVLNKGSIYTGAINIIKPIAEIVTGVRAVYPHFPVIVFARGPGKEHGRIAAATCANGVGVEEGLDIATLLGSLDAKVAVQGNMFNGLLLGDEGPMVARAREILQSMPRDRHIFNLGHGIQPETQISMVERLVKEVRDFG